MKSLSVITSQAFSIVNFRGALILDLVSRGVRVYALAPDFDDATRRQVVSLGAEPVDIGLQRTGMNPMRDICDAWALVNKLRELQSDVVLAYFVKPVIYGMLASWWVGVPHRIAMVEGLGYAFTLQPRGASWESLRRLALRYAITLMYRIALARAHKVIFLNQDDVAQFIRDRVVSPNKVELLGGIGVDLDEFSGFQKPIHPITFLLAARLLRDKGISEYVDAARKVKSLYPAARFILLGALDSNPGALKQSDVEGWVNEGFLEWPGHVVVKPWLAQASVFVLPSYREGLPRSTQEAMAMGLAVITTDVPGCRETVVDGRNGYLVPVQNVEALVLAMIKFLNNPESISAMGLESRRMAVQKFDVKKINARLLSLLDVP